MDTLGYPLGCMVRNESTDSHVLNTTDQSRSTSRLVRFMNSWLLVGRWWRNRQTETPGVQQQQMRRKRSVGDVLWHSLISQWNYVHVSLKWQKTYFGSYLGFYYLYIHCDHFLKFHCIQHARKHWNRGITDLRSIIISKDIRFHKKYFWPCRSNFRQWQHVSSERAQKTTKKVGFRESWGRRVQGGTRYMAYYYRYAKYHHGRPSRILAWE